MKHFGKISLAGIVLLCSLSTTSFAQTKNYPTQNKEGSVEYNATPNSPTLPLVQYPPPQNYPTSVQIGTPSYYYYYPPAYGPGYACGYAGPGYGAGPSAGVGFYNNGTTTQRGFYYTTPIPGQVNIGGGAGGWGGGGFGGYGGGYGGYNGGLFVP